MRVIVIGLGEVGQHIARTLSRERHNVTIVDSDAARVEAMQGELDALLVAGDGSSPAFLRQLGVGDADLLCGVTQSDPVNVIAALAAHQLGARQTVARVRDPQYFGEDDSFARDQLGIDFVINPSARPPTTSPRRSSCPAPCTSSTSPTARSPSPSRS